MTALIVLTFAGGLFAACLIDDLRTVGLCISEAASDLPKELEE